jgi:hypothetical protein
VRIQRKLSKYSHFLRLPEPQRRPANGSGHGGARTLESRVRACLFNCARENRKSIQDWLKMKEPGAATRCIIARRHIAEGHHAPKYSRFMRLISVKDSKARGSYSFRAESPGGRLMWFTLSGLGNNLCWANLPLEGKSAAHGQITERNYSVARMPQLPAIRSVASRGGKIQCKKRGMAFQPPRAFCVRLLQV